LEVLRILEENYGYSKSHMGPPVNYFSIRLEEENP